MCGIAGYFGNNEISSKQIYQIKSLLKHRGPDADGILQKKIRNYNLLFIHTRLSIIDLKTRSNQPFYYDNSILNAAVGYFAFRIHTVVSGIIPRIPLIYRIHFPDTSDTSYPVNCLC